MSYNDEELVEEQSFKMSGGDDTFGDDLDEPLEAPEGMGDTDDDSDDAFDRDH